MDVPTLRIAFALVAVCVLVLFYGVTYRSTRSAYSRWWCLSLAGFIAASSLFLLDGTRFRAEANSVGNFAGVLAAGCVWAGAGSLRGHRVARWQLFLPPLVVGFLTAIDDPAHDIWAGGAAYLAGMTLMIGLSAYELSVAMRAERALSTPRQSYRFALTAILVMSAAIALYYGGRTVVFVAVGPHARLFETVFGAQATTLATLILLVVVTSSMSALSHEQQAAELREQATRDGMTGALNRTEFLRLAQEVIADGVGAPAVVVADLDRFKDLNDRLGHDAGDRAVVAFAEACRQAVGSGGLVGRLGGDEFVMLLHDDTRAEHVVEEITRLLAAARSSVDMPTASFGIAGVGQSEEVGAVVTQADIALYQAKAAGRACAVRFDGRLPQPTQTYGVRPGIAPS